MNRFMDQVISWLVEIKHQRDDKNEAAADKDADADKDKDIVASFIEIDHVNYVRPLFAFDESSGTVHPWKDVLPDSVYICSETSQNYSVCLDDCMNQAETIFHKMFPNHEFMVDTTDKELDDDDPTRFSSELEEISYYKSALSLNNAQSHSAAVIEATEEVIYVKMVNR